MKSPVTEEMNGPPQVQETNSQQGSEPNASAQPQSEWDVVRAHVRENPRDADSWLRLVELAEDSKDYERINETYEALWHNRLLGMI